VHPQFQHAGVGSKLLMAAIDWAKVNGIGMLHLWPSKGLVPYYEKFGFKSTGPDQPFMRRMT
jgi:GNAT superfamily N-acetyltransferase